MEWLGSKLKSHASEIDSISQFCTEGEAVALTVVAGSIRVSLAILYAWPYLLVALKVKPYLLVALKVKYQVE